MGFYQIGKILFPLFKTQFVGATIKMFGDPAHGARIGLNSLLTFALQFERTQVALIKLIKSVRFSLFHGIPPYVICCRPKLGNTGSYTLI